VEPTVGPGTAKRQQGLLNLMEVVWYSKGGGLSASLWEFQSI
jgi:hypothetical protein